MKLLTLVCLFSLLECHSATTLTTQQVKSWADLIHTNLIKNLAIPVSGIEQLRSKYQDSTRVENWTPADVLDEYKQGIKDTLERRRLAVTRMMNTARKSYTTDYLADNINFHKCLNRTNWEKYTPAGGGLNTVTEVDELCFVRYLDGRTLKDDAEFGNADEGTCRRVDTLLDISQNLTSDGVFYGQEVNADYSAVHVPFVKYDREEHMLTKIKWTSRGEGPGGPNGNGNGSVWFTQLAKQNRQNDPYISYQFFCSDVGFMNYFPASMWTMNQDKVDMYDCRLQPWYINAATTPKQVVIMLDISGSMLGERFEIAKQTIENILDTITPQDYVNIIVLLRSSLNFWEDKHIGGIANFEIGFKKAFQLLTVCSSGTPTGQMSDLHDGYNSTRSSVNETCDNNMKLMNSYLFAERYPNDSIRIDDETQNFHKAIMLITDGAPDSYDDLLVELNQGLRVRIFSFLIGMEVTEFTEVREMACQNRGFFVHVSSLSEVQEKVQYYLRVLARPLKQDIARKYKDSEEDPTTKFEPLVQLTSLQLSQMLAQFQYSGGRFISSLHSPDCGRLFYEETFAGKSSVFVISLSVPTVAIDEKEKITNVYEAYKGLPYGGYKLPELVGVVGTHVPVDELKNLAPDYKLGGYAYSFLIDASGYVIFHPQHRPFRHNGQLSYSYDSTDLEEVEVEVPKSKDFSNALREKILKGERGTDFNQLTDIKLAYDFGNILSAKRIYNASVGYVYDNVRFDGRFGFGLGIAVPKGKNKRLGTTRGVEPQKMLKCLEGHNWRLHPSWEYCRPNRTNADKEVSFKDLLMNYDSAEARERCSNYEWIMKHIALDILATCDIEQTWIKRFNSDDENKNGILTVFVATHAGLTRYADMQMDKTSEGFMTKSGWLHSHKPYLNDEYSLADHIFEQNVKADQDDRKLRGLPPREFMEYGTHDSTDDVPPESDSAVSPKTPVETATEEPPVTASPEEIMQALHFYNSHGAARPGHKPFAEKGYMHFIHKHTAAQEEVFYQRAIRQPSGTFVFDVNKTNVVSRQKAHVGYKTANGSIALTGLLSNLKPNDHIESIFGRMESASITVSAYSSVFVDDVPAAVVGFEMLYHNFSQIVKDVLGDDLDLDSSDLSVFLLDEHGYVLFSSLNDSISDPKIIGDFIGTTQPCLAAQLWHNQIYDLVPYVDYQAHCTDSPMEDGGGVTRILNPFIAILRLLFWLCHEVVMLIREYGFFSLIAFNAVPSTAYTQFFTSDAGGYSCDRAMFRFLLAKDGVGAFSTLLSDGGNHMICPALSNSTPATGQDDEGGTTPVPTTTTTGAPSFCEWSLVAQRIRDSNMVLVASDMGTPCAAPECLTACSKMFGDRRFSTRGDNVQNDDKLFFFEYCRYIIEL